MNPNQVIKTKNSLLSCAVTGGFEEFTGSGIVLAAAVEKPVFTIGTPAISDTDNFSDVSLDRDGASDTATTPAEAAAFYSPLAELDSMGNLSSAPPPTLDLNQDQQQVDANLNPISAALAQLPNAASTVFSTFSNIIKGSAPYEPPQSEVQQQPPEPSVNPFGYALVANPDPNAPPPSFFSPTDESLFKKTTFEPQTNNTFRLGGNKKKTYAHIPGLSMNNQAMPSVQAFNPNPVMPPMPPQPVVSEAASHYQQPTNLYQQQQPSLYQQQPSPPKEPEKSSKFSLTSLLPSQLLEKIPSTKNLFGLNEPTAYDQQQPQQPSFNQNQDFNQDFSVTTSFDQPQVSNFFTSTPQHGDQQPEKPPQPQINYFNPQQFVTSPFSQPKVVEQNQVASQNLVQQQSSIASVPPMTFTSPPLTSSSTPFSAAQVFNQPPIPSASIQQQSEPPKIETVSSDTNCAPPTFFNPAQASDLFKTAQNDDGKPKNPYSSSRISRGVGLYKTRPAAETQNVQNVFMPPMPSFNNQPVQSQFSGFGEVQNVSSQPPSILPFGNYGEINLNQQQVVTQPLTTTNQATGLFDQANQYPPQTTLSDDAFKSISEPPKAEVLFPSAQETNNSLVQPPLFEPQPKPEEPIQPKLIQPPPVNSSKPAEEAPKTFFELPPAPAAIPQPVSNPFTESVQTTQIFEPQPIEAPKTNPIKKSDLNVPETSAEKPSAVNFFSSPTTPSAIDFFHQPITQQSENTSSALNFFHTEEVPQKDVQGALNDAPATSSINFFQPQPSAPEAPAVNPLENNFQEASGFFLQAPSVASVDEIPQNPEIESSFANLTVQANSDLINDISDKLESMSENIGSTLSLFATSELDASLAQKFSTPSESLIPKFLEARSTSSPAHSKSYRPVYRHWFYQSLYWHPFAMSDSLAIEDAITGGVEVVVTDGGRFEVNLKDRKRSSVYWSSGSNAIRRCSWFFKNPNGTESNLIPFDESTAEFLESEYEKAVTHGSWNHRWTIPNSQDFVLLKDPLNIEYHQMGQVLIVKRGVDEFVIDDGEEAPVDHLIVSVSNFGDKIDDSADELRSKFSETIQHYYSEAFDCGMVGRVEVLPISLNSVDILKMKETKGIIEAAQGGNSEVMKSSTYQDVIMKAAFYCNHEFYQNIMNHLSFSLNEIVTKFRARNSEFKGEISLIATSFEALFLFDLLLVQETAPEFWKLRFEIANFYAFGMPTNLLTIRNKTNFEVKHCKKFLNVVHRLDPVAQRIEPLIKPEFSKLPPESIENEAADRIDYTIADGSSLESFSLKNYFTSELIILRLTNDIYGTLKMDSGSL